MKLKIAAYAFTIFIILILQTTVLEYVKILNVKPNLLLVFIICVSISRGNVEGAVTGFFTGLAQDMLSGRIIGFYSLLGLYAGISLGSVHKRLYRDNFIVIVFFTLVLSIAYEWMVYFLASFGESAGNIRFFYPMVHRILPEALYNAFTSVFMYGYVLKLNKKLDALEDK